MLPFYLLLIFVFGSIVAYYVQTGIRFGRFEAMRTLAIIIPPVRVLLFSEKTRERYKNYLVDFPYYQQLSETDQEKFIQRICRFLALKRIQGSRISVNERMRVRLAASAIQLLFGIDEFYIPFFDQVRVYAGTFTLGGKKTGLEAIATRDGIIHISWPAFEKGYASPADSYNVGLFVFAQAMQVGVELYSGDDPLMTEQFGKWTKATAAVIRSNARLNSPLIPESVIRSRTSFFASCIEHFFEAPEKLHAAHPQLYFGICEVLWQNPLFKDNVPERPAVHSYAVIWRRQRKFAYFFLFCFVSCLISIPLLMQLSAKEAASDFLLLLLAVLPSGIILLPKLLRKNEKRGISAQSILGSIGLGGWSIGAFLLLNLIQTGDSYTETHPIQNCSVSHYTYSTGGGRHNYYSSYRTHNRYIATYEFADGAFSTCTLFRKFVSDANAFQKTGAVEFQLHRGLFGIPVLEKSSVNPHP